METGRTDLQEQDELFDLEAAAEQLCVSKTTLYRMLDRGEVKGVKVGRQWRFRQADLQSYLTRGPVAVALTALPVEVLDREMAAFAEKLASLGEAIPLVADTDLDQWEARVLQLLLGIVKLARLQRVSDIHFEVMAAEDELRGLLRFRIDGVLHEVHRFPQRVHEAIIMRVRLMASGEVGNGSYLDGCLHLPLDGHVVDLRISVMPTFLGEALTARLLSLDMMQQTTLDGLGFRSADLPRIRQWMTAPAGLILVAGTTGSGKTTLLYKLLQEVAGPQRKVASVEDPVEQQLPWVTQVEVNAKSRNIASVLRAFMYQYIDVVMVSTLRDLETIDLALVTAETGHLALAPVHVVSAVDPARRVVDVFPLEQQPSIRTMLAKLLLGIVAMRLARVLCPHCRQPDDLSPTALAHVRELARQGGYTLPDDAVFFRAAGCAACGYTGYHGRTGLYEVLEVDAAFRAAVLHNAPREELLQIALAGGMHTLTAEGVRKAAEGITSLDEIVSLDEEAMAGEHSGVADESKDALYDQALAYIRTAPYISTSMLQRRFRIGYTQAVQLMDTLTEHGVISPGHGGKPREVIGNPSSSTPVE